MAEEPSREARRRLLLGLLAIALVAAASVWSYERWAARPSSPATPPPVAQTPPAPVQPTPAPDLTPPPPLDRAALLSAAAAAAAAYASGEGDVGQAALVGRRFSAMLAFGCEGPRPEDAAGDPPPAYWTLDPKRRRIEVTVTPQSWTEAPFAARLTDGLPVDAVQGFWLSRPWIPTGACPAAPAATAGAPGAAPETVGLAEIFPEGASRIARRDGRPYQTTLEAPADGAPAAPQGYRLVLEGRVTGYADGQAIRCLGESPDQRPVCIFGVDVERVAVRNPATGLGAPPLAEWQD